MSSWTDPFTGVVYEWEDQWSQAVRRFLVQQLVPRLKDVMSAEKVADAIARFWREYYELVFPLRFGKAMPTPTATNNGSLSNSSDATNFIHGVSLFAGSTDKIILGQSNIGFRTRFLDGNKLPPILNSESDDKALIADHHLACAALLNVALRSEGVTEDIVHAVRLGALVHELSSEAELMPILESVPLAKSVAEFLRGDGDCPQELREDKDLIKGIHDHNADLINASVKMYVVGVAAQRIKQYVFESAGLNEIRGASEILDGCVSTLASEIENEIGPEVLLQTVASTLTFLAPRGVDMNGIAWPERLREFFLKHTGTALVASEALETTVQRMLQSYSDVMRDFFSEIESDRYQGDVPLIETLPFERRCTLCNTRPAEGTYRTPEKDYDPLCRSCYTKRSVGREKRRSQWDRVMKPLAISESELGVQREMAPDLKSLIPDNVAHRYMAFIYGDGSNFGPIVKNLKSLSQAFHWTHRAEKVALAAASIALGESVQEGASQLQANFRTNPPFKFLPFQVLAIGGDDLSLFTWGGVALRFCQVFLELTDIEFQIGSGVRIVGKDKPICFGLGALVCDEKTPVRNVVEFTHSGLLKWAKKAVPHYKRGAMTFLLASTAEQIPGDLDAYQERMYYSGSGKSKACLTLRPLSAQELDGLLRCAIALKSGDHSGRLQRLVGAFVDKPLLPALLHYVYQQARGSGEFFDILKGLQRRDFMGGQGNYGESTVFPASQLKRNPMGGSSSKQHYFSPLWDLMEMVKILP